VLLSVYSWFPAAQKILKKVKKKLACPWRPPLNGDLTRQIGLESRSKKFEKSEKKSLSAPQKFNKPAKT
jgi:hypothetical protein